MWGLGRPAAGRWARRSLGAFAVVGVLVSAAACGDDDDGDAIAATTTAEAPDGEQHDGPVNPCAPDAPADAAALEGEAASADATVVDVTAIDHEFRGVDDTYPAGDYGFRMTNRGDEAHELALIRIEPGETRSIAELLELSDEESEEVTEYVGGSVACPGKSAEALGVALKPGRYALVCFIPAGLTPDVPSTEAGFEKLGAPHFAMGMTTEFEVTGG